MLKAGPILFLQLQKTGCTHVEKKLSEYLTCSNYSKHGRLDILDSHQKYVVGGVRNPWDWYVSFYAYACEMKGGITSQYLLSNNKDWRNRTARSYFIPHKNKITHGLSFLAHEFKHDPLIWRNLLVDVHNTDNFRIFIKKLLAPENRYASTIDYGFSSHFNEIGLYTYLYLLLYLDDANRLFKNDRQLRKLINNRINLTELLVVERFLHTESLDYDVAKLLYDVGKSKACTEVSSKPRQLTNASKRKYDYRKYYDLETQKLIESKENLIIKHHGYSF